MEQDSGKSEQDERAQRVEQLFTAQTYLSATMRARALGGAPDRAVVPAVDPLYPRGPAPAPASLVKEALELAREQSAGGSLLSFTEACATLRADLGKCDAEVAERIGKLRREVLQRWRVQLAELE